jgi:hypothetical protein
MGMNTIIPLPVLFQAGLLEQNQTMLQLLLKKQHEFSPQKHGVPSGHHSISLQHSMASHHPPVLATRIPQV